MFLKRRLVDRGRDNDSTGSKEVDNLVKCSVTVVVRRLVIVEKTLRKGWWVCEESFCHNTFVWFY